MNKNTVISQKCIATNRNGEACKNFKYSDSEFCYIHNLTRRSRVKFYKNPKTHFILAVISIILALYFGINSSSIENQEIIIANQDTTTQTLQEIKDLLLSDMARIQKQREDEFLKTYDLGYQLVAFDRYNNVIPSKSRIRFDFTINWDGTELIKLASGKLQLKLPTLKEIKSDSNISNNIIYFYEGTLGYIAGATFPSFRIVVEGIDYKYYGYICLIGLMNKNK